MILESLEIRPRIALLIIVPRQHMNILRLRILPIARNPILGRHVHVSEQRWGCPRNRISSRRDAIILLALLGQEIRGRDAPYSRAAEGVELGVLVEPFVSLADVCGREGGDGGAEGVAGDDEAVVRVGLGGGEDVGDDHVAHAGPGFPEAVVDAAGGAEVGADECDFEVFDPVLVGVGASEGEDDELVFGVDGYET